MKIDRILVIRFSSLGDIILLSSLFKEIKKCFPKAEVDFLTSTTFSQVCSNNPHINRILALDRKNGSRELIRIIDEVRQSKYDLVLDAHQSLRSRLLLIKSFGILK